MGLDEFAFKGGNFFRVIKLHNVHGLVRAHGVQCGNRQHMRVPLHHDVGVVSEPDGPLFGRLAVAIVQQRVVPALVNGRACGGFRLRQALGHTHRLHGVVLAKFPLQVVAGHKLAESGVEGPHVVVLQVHLDKGLPVVIALVHLDFIEHVALKVQVGARPHVSELLRNVHPIGFKQESIPLLQGVVVQVEARVVGEVGRTYERAHLLGIGRGVCAAVGPAVQWTDDIAAILALPLCPSLCQRATTFEHECLAVAADVGNQFNALGAAYQGAAFIFLGQRVIVANFGHAQGVAYISGTVRKNALHFQLVQGWIKVAGNRQLREGRLLNGLRCARWRGGFVQMLHNSVLLGCKKPLREGLEGQLPRELPD